MLPECVDSRPTTLVVTAAHARQKVHIGQDIIDVVLSTHINDRVTCNPQYVYFVEKGT
jgi:hypothetical protein